MRDLDLDPSLPPERRTCNYLPSRPRDLARSARKSRGELRVLLAPPSFLCKHTIGERGTSRRKWKPSKQDAPLCADWLLPFICMGNYFLRAEVTVGGTSLTSCLSTMRICAKPSRVLSFCLRPEKPPGRPCFRNECFSYRKHE